MDRPVLQAWLDRYVQAWKSYDPDAIGALFGEDATYRYHPYDGDDQVIRGRDAGEVDDTVEALVAALDGIGASAVRRVEA